MRWAVLVLNGIVIFATPVEGGHHWVDVFAGLPVAVLAIAGASQIYRLATQAGMSPLALPKEQMAPAE